MGCNCGNKCKCITIGKIWSCHPSNDVQNPKRGQLWIKDTDYMYYYDGNKWCRIPNGLQLPFIFTDAETTTDGTGDATLVRSFIFPDGFASNECECLILDNQDIDLSPGYRIYRMDYSHAWSQLVEDQEDLNGIIVTLQDKQTKEAIIIGQHAPSSYQKFESEYEIIYQPNAGDSLEITISKPNDEPDGFGILYNVKLYLVPYQAIV